MSMLNAILETASLRKAALFTWGLCLPLDPAFACVPLNEALGLSICVADTSWEQRDSTVDHFLFYNTADDFAGSVRILDGGTEDGLESEGAARLIARADSEEIRDFALLKAGEVSSGNFVYAARGSANGRSSIYVNTVSVAPTRTLRITTWRLGDTLTDRDREMHVAFGQLLKTGP